MTQPNDKRLRNKGRKETGTFVMLRHDVLNSSAYVRLSAHAIKLLIDIAAQYRGKNNGDLATTWSMMKLRGWRSRDTLGKALRELLDAGFIEQTRQGGMHKPSLYALTWFSIDECGGKLDVPATTTASRRWKNTNPNTPCVSIQHGGRVNWAPQSEQSTRGPCLSSTGAALN